MGGQCGCANLAARGWRSLGCLECGAACCPACAIHLESATYCASCARALLGTASVRAGGSFDLY